MKAFFFFLAFATASFATDEATFSFVKGEVKVSENGKLVPVKTGDKVSSSAKVIIPTKGKVILQYKCSEFTKKEAGEFEVAQIISGIGEKRDVTKTDVAGVRALDKDGKEIPNDCK